MRKLKPANTDPALQGFLKNVNVLDRNDIPECDWDTLQKDGEDIRRIYYEFRGLGRTQPLRLDFRSKSGNVTEIMLLNRLNLWFPRPCSHHWCRHDEDSERASKHIAEATRLLPQSDQRPDTRTMWSIGGDFEPIVVLAILEDRLGDNPDRELAKRSVRDAIGALWNKRLQEMRRREAAVNAISEM